jgi:hypothetical protein
MEHELKASPERHSTIRQMARLSKHSSSEPAKIIGQVPGTGGNRSSGAGGWQFKLLWGLSVLNSPCQQGEVAWWQDLTIDFQLRVHCIDRQFFYIFPNGSRLTGAKAILCVKRLGKRPYR